MSGGAILLDVGLACALGRSFPDASKAYVEGRRLFRRHGSVIGPDGMPMTLGAAIPYEELRDYPERLMRLCDMALSDLDARFEIPPGTILRLTIQEWMRHSPAHREITAGIVYACGRKAARVQFHYGGAAEAVSLIGDSAAAIAQGKADFVMVGAVDSFMQVELLDRLTIQGRIPSKLNPYGGIPAEAACILLIAAEGAARNAKPLGQVLAVFRGREDEDVMQPKGIIGRGLAAAYRQAASYHAPDRLLADLNGERWRAEEFGFAASAAGARIADLVAGVEAPALYAGDCGTAMGPLMTALALTDPPRRAHPSPGRVALVSASSRLGPRAAIFVERFAEGGS